MLRSSRRSQLLAASSVFAAVFAILGFIPISRLVGIGQFITFREAISPVAGMVLGPAAGGLSVVIGVFLDLAAGKTPVFLGLDFMIDLAAALTAGLAFTGRRLLAAALPTAAVFLLVVGPASPATAGYGGVPFVWMHVGSVALLCLALILESRGRIRRLSWPFVGATMLASTMCAHAVGGILTEYVYLSSGQLFGYGSVGAYWNAIFLLYPLERAFIAVVGTMVAYPALRGISARQRGTRASG